MDAFVSAWVDLNIGAQPLMGAPVDGLFGAGRGSIEHDLAHTDISKRQLKLWHEGMGPISFILHLRDGPHAWARRTGAGGAVGMSACVDVKSVGLSRGSVVAR